MSNLQGIAERLDAIVTINSSWNFSAIDKPLFYMLNEKTSTEADYNELREAFVGNMRYFHEDPVWAHYYRNR
jgi:hypothetical protein